MTEYQVPDIAGAMSACEIQDPYLLVEISDSGFSGI